MSFVRRLLDERFWDHRRRSTSIAGISCAACALLLFEYYLLFGEGARWDLLAVGLVFVVVKIGLMVRFSVSN
jgi:hypothetical protein